MGSGSFKLITGPDQSMEVDLIGKSIDGNRLRLVN